MQTPMLEARDITLSYHLHGEEIQAVLSASLSCLPGSITLLQGPSGGGKSSLFSVLGGLIPPTAGQLWLMGKQVDQLSDRQRTAMRRREVALIFQAYNLFPTLTAAENVAYPLRDVRAEDVRKLTARALECVGLSHRMNVRPDRLSGGEQQRVAVARALAQEPSILLADEPTGALDTDNAENIMTILRNFADERKATVFLISHDPMTVQFADQRLVITDGVLDSV
jgi:putative ABC transport system ATP-binding protein